MHHSKEISSPSRTDSPSLTEELSIDKSSWLALKERGLSFCSYVQYSKTAQIQIVWLLICLTAFKTIGIVELDTAHSNVTSAFKPEKIESVIDYGDATHQYYMPWIYIVFRVLTPKEYNETGTYWTNATTSSTLSRMLETVDFENMSVRMSYFNDWEKTWVPSSWEEFSVNLLGNFSDLLSGKTEIVACFKLKLPDPDPSQGPFSIRFSIYRNHMTLWDTLNVVDVRLTVSRGEPSPNYLDHRALQISKWIDGHGLSVSYDEKVVKTVNPVSTAHEFSLYARTTWDTADNGTLDIIIFPNLVVPEWSEYVEFGYFEWLGMMGGYFTILSFVFLSVSRYFSKWLQDESLGILPLVSHKYRNHEKISLLESQLEDSERELELSPRRDSHGFQVRL